MKHTNPYEGVTYVPVADKFMASIGDRRVAICDSLEAAIAARRDAMRKRSA
jgi:hypothetical protein